MAFHPNFTFSFNISFKTFFSKIMSKSIQIIMNVYFQEIRLINSSYSIYFACLLLPKYKRKIKSGSLLDVG